MSKKIALLLALLLVVPVISHAQDAVTPWPPDPNTLFAPGVEMMAAQEVEVTSTKLPYGFSSYADNTTRKVYLYDEIAKVWKEYPYPDNVDAFIMYGVKERSDGLVFVYSSFYPPQAWLLNPETGEFLKPKTRCGTLQDAPDDGQWVMTLQEADIPEYRLCFTETGETTVPLPSLQTWHDWTAIGTSPNKDWVVLSPHACYGMFYAYYVPTNTLHQLGELKPALADHCWLKWQDNTFFVLVTSSMNPSAEHSIVTGDVTEEDSLKIVLVGLGFEPPYYENPARYEVAFNTNDSNPTCILQIYYVEDRRFVQYDLGRLCGFGLSTSEDYSVRYFRPLEGDLNNAATLVRYDLKTGQRTDLFTGEIEQVVGISPDSRYIVLIMDSNGRIDVLPNENDAPVLLESPYWAVFDTQENRLIYQLKEDAMTIGIIAPSADWFAQNTGLRLHRSHSEFHSVGRWIWLDTGEIISVNDVKKSRYSDDKQRIILINQITADKNRCMVSVLNLQKRELTPITREFEMTDCNLIDVEWQEDNTLNLTLKPGNEAETAMQYTVRLPD